MSRRAMTACFHCARPTEGSFVVCGRCQRVGQQYTREVIDFATLRQRRAWERMNEKLGWRQPRKGAAQ